MDKLKNENKRNSGTARMADNNKKMLLKAATYCQKISNMFPKIPIKKIEKDTPVSTLLNCIKFCITCSSKKFSSWIKKIKLYYYISIGFWCMCERRQRH